MPRDIQTTFLGYVPADKLHAPPELVYATHERPKRRPAQETIARALCYGGLIETAIGTVNAAGFHAVPAIMPLIASSAMCAAGVIWLQAITFSAPNTD